METKITLDQIESGISLRGGVGITKRVLIQFFNGEIRQMKKWIDACAERTETKHSVYKPGRYMLGGTKFNVQEETIIFYK